MRVEEKRNYTNYSKVAPKQEQFESLSKLNNSSSNKPIDSEGKDFNAALGILGKGVDYVGVAAGLK